MSNRDDRRTFHGPVQPEWISGNIFIRANEGNAGDRIDGHSHNFDHTTFVLKGRVRIKCTMPDGSILEQECVPPSHVLIPAQAMHEMTFLDDDSILYCVYSHRDPQGRVSVEYTGWREAYL